MIMVVMMRMKENRNGNDDCTYYLQLLSKMAPLIGKDMSEAIFLERFAALCVDPLFHVRKVCAANFGDFSSVVGMESTEKVLVSHATFSTIAGNSSSSRASKFNVLRRRRMRREAEHRRLEGQNPQILEQLTFKAIFIF